MERRRLDSGTSTQLLLLMSPREATSSYPLLLIHGWTNWPAPRSFIQTTVLQPDPRTERFIKKIKIRAKRSVGHQVPEKINISTVKRVCIWTLKPEYCTSRSPHGQSSEDSHTASNQDSHFHKKAFSLTRMVVMEELNCNIVSLLEKSLIKMNRNTVKQN